MQSLHDFIFANENVLVKKILDSLEVLINLDNNSSLTAIMGRSSKRPESLFEILFSIPEITRLNSDNIIRNIWNKFELFQTPEIISHVSEF